MHSQKAHSKSEYKRLIAQGADVEPPDGCGEDAACPLRSLPALQGHWRLLEKNETVTSDQYLVGADWAGFCRRVAQLPTCATCATSTVDPKIVQQYSSDTDLAPGAPDERICLAWEAFVPHDGYCHLHTDAQGVTR